MEESLARMLAGEPSLLAFIAAFIAGILSVATPCVLPMIPITLGAMGATGTRSRGRALLVSSCYVAGIVLCFSALGVFFGLTGKVFGSLAGVPAINAAIALLLLVMAANAFGLFTFGIPRPLQRLANSGGAGPAGAFVMGLVAGIVAMPCIGPVLAGILTYVGTTGDAVFGGLMLATYALGFGLPFVLFGALSLKLPKGRKWTETVERLFGVLLAGGAFFFLRLAFPILQVPGSYVMGALGIVAALIFTGPMRPNLKGRVASTAWKLAAVGVSLAGMGLVMNQALRKPLIDWCEEKEGASCLPATCRGNHATILVFGAEWCSYCQKMDETTFADPRVQKRLKEYGTVHVDVDKNGEFASRFRIRSVPTTVFLDAQCREMGRLMGYKDAENFLKVLDDADEASRQR